MILSAVLTAVEAMDSALSIWEVKGCTGKPLSPSMDLLRMDWSLTVRGRDPKLDTLGMPARACRLTTPDGPRPALIPAPTHNQTRLCGMTACMADRMSCWTEHEMGCRLYRLFQQQPKWINTALSAIPLRSQSLWKPKPGCIHWQVTVPSIAQRP